MTDLLGSVTDVIDSNGELRIHRAFDSFGNTVGEDHYDTAGDPVTSNDPEYVDEAFAFTGGWFDKNTDSQNNLNRWYDSSTGRWMSEDPIGFAAGDANLYRYVGNEPTRWIDPTGFNRFGDIGAGIRKTRLIGGIRKVLKEGGIFEGHAESKEEAICVVREAFKLEGRDPDVFDDAPPHRKSKSFYQVHPPDRRPDDLPHIKFCDWTKGKFAQGGAKGHITFPAPQTK